MTVRSYSNISVIISIINLMFYFNNHKKDIAILNEQKLNVKACIV